MKTKKKIMLLMFCGLLVFSICGCSKETALIFFNEGTQMLGDLPLTFGLPLKGERRFGDNHYTGTYIAAYDDFSGEEAILGGTSLMLPADSIHVICTLSCESGSARLEFRSIDQHPLALCREGETYTGELALPAGSNYLCVVAEHFTGSINLTVE